MAEISQKQKLFADEFIKTGNAEQAAKVAGYNARGNTTKLLQNTTIKEYISSINNALDSNKIATMSEVKQFWSDMLRNKNVEPRDRLKASEYIAKTNAAFVDNHNITGELLINIIDDLGDEDDDEDEEI